MFKAAARRLCSSSVRQWQQSAEAMTMNGNKVMSSCPAGTPLKVNVKKGGKDPLALEDSEYPAWLWTILDKEAQLVQLSQDPIKLRRKQLRKANRESIKQKNFLKQI